MNDYDRSDEYVNDYDESDEYMNYYDRSDEYMNDYDRSDQYMNDYDRSDEYRNGLFFQNFYYHLKYLALKAKLAGGTLTQTVKQPYGVCCLTGSMFKGVQWGDMNIMKMMSKNISKPLSLTYPNIFVKF